MSKESDHSITQLLTQWRQGDERALHRLTSRLYPELKQIAQLHLRRERSDHTLERTALVHEAFLRLASQQAVDWQNRAQFLALASQLMRRILVDYARSRHAAKRGGPASSARAEHSIPDRAQSNDSDASAGSDDPHSPSEIAGDLQTIELVDEALTRLGVFDQRQAQVVELRYFGGLTIDETAQVLGISDATVKREWTLARAWLRRELDRRA